MCRDISKANFLQIRQQSLLFYGIPGSKDLPLIRSLAEILVSKMRLLASNIRWLHEDSENCVQLQSVTLYRKLVISS